MCPARLVVFCFGLLAVGLAGRAESPEFGYPVRWVLDDRGAGNTRVITSFVPPTTNRSPIPAIPVERAALNEVKGILQKVQQRVLENPLPESRLLELLASLDSSREWLRVVTDVPDPIPGTILVVYRHKSAEFLVHLGIADHAGDQQSLTLAPGVTAKLGPGVLDDAVFAAAARTAAQQAFDIASQHGMRPLAPMISSEAQTALAQNLAGRFQLPGLTIPQSKYLLQGRPQGDALAASDLWVDPVFIPRQVAIELKNWKLEEADQPPAIVRKLQIQRAREEEKVRRELDGLIPAGRQLVTTDEVKRWTESPLGKKFSLAPLRQENDILVLEAATDVPRLAITLSPGLTYGATQGLQGTASLHVVRDLHSHFDTSLEAAAGDDARSGKAALSWAPLRLVWGWKLNVDGSAEIREQDEALFGDATAGTPVSWRHSRGRIGARALRVDDAKTSDRWSRTWLVQLSLAHTDDDFDHPLAAAASDRPDTALEAKLDVEFKRTTPHLALTIHPSLRAAHALGAFDGNYDYRLTEAALTASAITQGGDWPWKVVAGARAGRIRDGSPASVAFRAGGDAGWIRGLREGEVAGTRYQAQTFALGPEVSRLLPDGKLPATFLLAFVDWGRVRDTSAWQSVRGIGVALNVDSLELGPVPLSLTLGYAYSRQSQLDPHGAVFVRVELPFSFTP